MFSILINFWITILNYPYQPMLQVAYQRQKLRNYYIKKTPNKKNCTPKVLYITFRVQFNIILQRTYSFYFIYYFSEVVVLLGFFEGQVEGHWL